VALKTDLHDLKNEQMVQAVNFEESQQTLLQERIANLQTNIQFQTASVAIEDVYQPQLAGIADLLNQFPELTARLEGYADQRGDSDFNQALSIARAEAVANLLLEMNVDKSQLTYAGNGEAVNRDLTQAPKESLFFDRRVNIQILPKGQIMTAAK
ncbi:MAG: OmpA family protein, partial [Pseudomonadota bacterium]